MKNKWGLLIVSFGLLFLLTGCFSVNEPITSNSEGIWNSIFVYPVSWLIINFAEAFNSYGLAIVALTILIRLVIMPLMIKQTKSMKAMQLLQPEMQKLREKYSAKDQNTQQKLQSELMGLYKERGVNPFAGCLPLVIQMPILLALYHAIMRTSEISGHSFLWFILDQPDPIFLLPLVAGAATYVQQKMMMVQHNPQMQILLYAMPIMITVFGLFLPSAVILYWVVGNLFMIAQTYFITGPNVEQRKATKAGVGGKSDVKGNKGKGVRKNNRRSSKKRR
ncbi:YidC family membrane integrase SpoIIIJ [Alkalicoccobacillus porphyridii]|uniref:Membrane protein insertase YidC n=1 Tax=Alkalicoccobacillus porphyridii TaxID=2597270 RepID=A0A554A1H5_9BACI|nr:YidC family membrane integrase SpoIIIJ [Alkalicoccobacillus porphyridii]TSB47538.1 YidC family membrane integrase SpoIIIJ [Alkalicoccobacillus porphyridii]